MNLRDICRFANITYKSKYEIEKFLALKKIDIYSANEIDEYKYIYFIDKNVLHIAIRGSYNLENFIEGITAKSIEEGFVKILHHIMDKDVLFSEIVDKIVITGHSLGGSIAIRLANHIKSIDDKRNVSCYAFVPMKPYKKKVKSVADIFYFTVYGDFVALFPFNYHIDGYEINFNKNGRIKKQTSIDKFIGVIKGIFKKDYGIIKSHSVEVLLSNISKNYIELRRLGLWE
jgi:hypothetical protein